MQKEKVKNLLTLIKENPDLPIVPKVDSEIVADEGFSYWIGGWGSAEVDEMVNGAEETVVTLNEERVYFKSEDDEEIMDSIADNFSGMGIDATNITDEMVEGVLEELNWQKVIAVSITLPEEDD